MSISIFKLPMRKLTVCLLTFNSERLLDACLSSLIKVADEVVAVDSGSTDATLDILTGYGLEPIFNPYRCHSDQMNYAISWSSNDWVLCMDSDEILDTETIDHILQLKQEKLIDPTVAYRLSRYWYVLGRPVHAIYPISSPDYPVRLFNRTLVKFNDAPVDDKPIGFSSTEVIKGHVVHDTFNTLAEVSNKLESYTTRLCKLKAVEPSLAKALISPYFAFIKWYFVKGGWKDGSVGLVTGYYAFAYTFLKYFKAWQGKGKR